MRASTELTAGVCVNVGESVRVCFLSGGRCLRGLLSRGKHAFAMDAMLPCFITER